ncbi:MAG: hypothetical protein ACOVP9_09575 [Flavobacterium stagni]
MKKQALLMLLFLCSLGYGQASGSSELNLTLQFDWKFPVEKIKIYSFEKKGNYIEKINCTTDHSSNSITIRGSIHYITGVNFPTLVCSYEDFVYIDNTPIEKNKLFYLITNGLQSVATDKPFVFTEDVGVIEIKRIQKEGSYDIVINTYPELIFTPMNRIPFTNATLRLK